MTAVSFASGQAMRDWLEANHATGDALWVGIYKKGSSKTGVTLPKAQDVAMCFADLGTRSSGTPKGADGGRDSVSQGWVPR